MQVGSFTGLDAGQSFAAGKVDDEPVGSASPRIAFMNRMQVQ